MKMHTPTANQGQIVEVSYGWSEGSLYRRTHDRSDGTTSWERASDEDEVSAYAESSEGLWDAEPPVRAWTRCAEPREAE